MKVRLRKDSGSTLGAGPFEVIDEGKDFYIIDHFPTCQFQALNKRYWEPVPTEPPYRDVTGECELRDKDVVIYRDGINIHDVVTRGAQVYRLRKVQMIQFEQGERVVKWAFIVEKRCDDSGA